MYALIKLLLLAVAICYIASIDAIYTVQITIASIYTMLKEQDFLLFILLIENSGN